MVGYFFHVASLGSAFARTVNVFFHRYRLARDSTTFGFIFKGALESDKETWACQRQKRYGFSSTACDQVMKQTFNRDSKTKGGITRFTLNRSAAQRWILSQSERGSITRQ